MPLVSERPRPFQQETRPSQVQSYLGINEVSFTNEQAEDALRNPHILFQDDQIYLYINEDEDRTQLTTDEVLSNVREAFRNAQGEEFENGVDSDFADELEKIINDYSNRAISTLDEVIEE